MHSFTQFDEEERKRRKRERERGERPKQFVLLGPGHKVFVTLTLAGWPDDLMGRMCHSWGGGLLAGCVGVSTNLTADVWSKSPRELAHVFCRALRKKRVQEKPISFAKFSLAN